MSFTLSDSILRKTCLCRGESDGVANAFAALTFSDSPLAALAMNGKEMAGFNEQDLWRMQ